VSLGADLLSIYDNACRNLGAVTDIALHSEFDYIDDDEDCVDMLPAEELSSVAATPGAGGSKRCPERRTTAALAPEAQRGDERPVSKRPLSVSSTSSSMSSTSSLPRHEPKKLATAVPCTLLLPGVEHDGEAASLSTVAEHVPACSRPRENSEVRGREDVVEDDDVSVGHSAASTLSRSQYVDRVVTEIVDTERAYVDDLDQIIHVCMLYLRDLIKHD